MTRKTDTGTAAASPSDAEHAEQRRRLIGKLATGGFGAPVIMTSMARKAATAS